MMIPSQRKEDCKMSFLELFAFEDVDDLIFIDSIWSRSQR